MAVEFKRNDYSGHFPEIWRGECKILPGGFKPAQTIPAGTVLRRGVPIYVDFDNMTAAICKTAKVLTGGTTTKPRVTKGHYFAVGDTVIKSGAGAKHPTVKGIDTSNADYDVIEFSEAITGLAADDILVEGTAPDSGNAEAKYTPNMIVGAERLFDGKGLPTIDAAYEAVVLIPSLASPMLADWLNGVCLKNNPNIIYIKQ